MLSLYIDLILYFEFQNIFSRGFRISRFSDASNWLCITSKFTYFIDLRSQRSVSFTRDEFAQLVGSSSAIIATWDNMRSPQNAQEVSAWIVDAGVAGAPSTMTPVYQQQQQQQQQQPHQPQPHHTMNWEMVTPAQWEQDESKVKLYNTLNRNMLSRLQIITCK